MDQLSCLRCKSPIQHIGTRNFREGGGVSFFLGDWAELLKNMKYDVYLCNACGKIEMFADGIAEASRAG